MSHSLLLLTIILAVMPLETARSSSSDHCGLASSAPELTPQVVWNHSDAIYQQCDIPNFDCVLQLLKFPSF